MVFGFGNDKFEVLDSNGQPKQVQMTDALQKLSECKKISIKQRINKLEILTCDCFESKNKYDVYDGDGKKIFYVHENTGCLMRQVQNYAPDCAPWDVVIDYTGGWTTSEAYHMKRECTACTCLCINRPIVEITDAEGTKLGSIRDPWACIPTNMTFTVMDENDENVLWAQSGCCQWGLCCPMPCGPCKSVDFPIVDKDNNQVGELQKRMKGLLKMCLCSWCFDDVESYKVEFSDDLKDPRQRALIMALAIFADFRYFSNTEKGEDAEPAE